MRSVRTLLMLLAVGLPVVPAFAQLPTTGQMVGNWKLNPKLSNFGPAADTAPKGIVTTVTSDTPDLVKFETSYTASNGMTFSWKFSGPADGKDHPADGTSTTFAYSRDGDNEVEVQKDTDGTVTKGVLTLSPNKKVATWNCTITDPQGAVTTEKLVFDRLP